MSVVWIILLVAMFCLTPAGVIWLCRRYPLLDKLGPIMVLYAVGMLVGNLKFIPAEIGVVQDIMPNVLIPLAIPMMLYGCRFSSGEVRLQSKIVLSGFLSVMVAVVVGYLLFGRSVEQGAEVGGIITGMYTGGTLNAAALQAIVKLSGESYVLINSYDIIISFIYFVFLFSIGIRAFRALYRLTGGKASNAECVAFEVEGEPTVKNPYLRILSRRYRPQVVRILLLTLLVVSISAGVALLMPEGWFMVVFILLLTTLGVVCSFSRKVRSFEVSYNMGMYLIFIFSMVIASMADFSHLDLARGLNQLAFMTVAVFISLALHAVVCRLLKVDADSMIISSVAFINSPPFVPMAAAAMRNKNAIVTGLGAGIVGYAAGNHLGVLMISLLNML